MIAYYDYEGNIDIYLNVLNAIIGSERESMIDLGCCRAPNTPMLRFKERVYVDVIDRVLDHKEEQQFFKQVDVLNLVWPYESDKKSVAFALDVVEHLTIANGFKLLKLMENISLKQILFTPLTDLFGMVKEDDNNPESHRSLWSPEMTPDYASLVFPNYHKAWNGGAYFLFKTPNTKQDFESVKLKLKEYGIHERNV